MGGLEGNNTEQEWIPAYARMTKARRGALRQAQGPGFFTVSEPVELGLFTVSESVELGFFTVSEPVELAGDFKHRHIIMFRTHLVFPDASWGAASSKDWKRSRPSHDLGYQTGNLLEQNQILEVGYNLLDLLSRGMRSWADLRPLGCSIL